MLRILIADDNTGMRQMLRETVAGLASAVYEAQDGGEAIRIGRQGAAGLGADGHERQRRRTPPLAEAE